MYKYNSLKAGQLPLEHLSFLQNLLNFIITKHLKQEVDDDLIVCVDERNPCGLAITGDKDKPLYKDLSRVTCNYATSSAGNGITTPTEKLPYRGLYRVAFTAEIW